jgi:hypothetical protein
LRPRAETTRREHDGPDRNASDAEGGRHHPNA